MACPAGIAALLDRDRPARRLCGNSRATAAPTGDDAVRPGRTGRPAAIEGVGLQDGGVPGSGRWSVRCWSGAVAAGVAETVAHLAIGEHELAPVVARVIVYAVVGSVIRWWARGHRWAGWTLLAVLGTVGLASLLVEPLTWWYGGGAPLGYLASAGPWDRCIVALRALHVLAVLAGAATTAGALVKPRSRLAVDD